MKQFLSILVLTALGSAPAMASCVDAAKGGDAACKNEVKSEASAFEKSVLVKSGDIVTLKVKGMHCGSCAAKITSAIQEVEKTARDVKVDPTSGQATFVCGNKKGCVLGPVLESISSAGYKASLFKQGT